MSTKTQANPDWPKIDAWDSEEELLDGPAQKGNADLDPLRRTLSERGARYGAFIGHAAIAQELKRSIFGHASRMGKQLDPDMSEALEMIAHKIGRIVNGDPCYVDSWVDIAGYAQLVADRLNGTVR